MSETTSLGDTLGRTALWTASVRAYENTRADRLFEDPWAESLAGEQGREWMKGRTPDSVAPIIIRTHYFDGFLQRIARENGIRQIVLMAAGLDTRAFRLDWPEETQVFELDQASVLAHKESILAQAGAQPACHRRTIGIDLTEDWADALGAAGFDPQQPSCWLLEGFLFYIPDEAIVRILDEASRLASPGSWLGFDIVNRITLTHPLTRSWLDMQAEAGAPWIGSLDDPVGFLAERGWEAALTQGGQPDANYDRWVLPVIPTLMPDMPHNWFVTAEKV
ncbi:MAG: SAM-dependent methyltransferase [Anaerolineae bacterium]|nr:SAM-dependent methyltransferase [Anaerolineae bacterium]